MTLGDVIKKYRKDHGMSQRDFTRASGLSTPYVSQLENNENPKTGKPPIPSVTTFMQVADAIHVDIFQLMNMVDENRPPFIEYYAEDGSKQTTYFVEKFYEDNIKTDGDIGSELNEQEKRLLRYFASLSESDKAMVEDFAKRLSGEVDNGD